MKVDPGTGDPKAALGTPERAKFVRLKLTVLVLDLPKTPTDFAGWWGELIATYPDPKGGKKTIHGWQLIGDDEGSPSGASPLSVSIGAPGGSGSRRRRSWPTCAPLTSSQGRSSAG